jgi:hypothetical protein
MHKLVLATLILFCASAGAALACGEDVDCRLDIPGGASAGLYADPAKADHQDLPNGTHVTPIQEKAYDGVLWTQLGAFNESWGYVPADMLVCDKQDDADGPICTITNPAGSSVSTYDDTLATQTGSFDNGVRVRPYDQIDKDGKSWRAIEFWESDNVLGWVQERFLNCDATE